MTTSASIEAHPEFDAVLATLKPAEVERVIRVAKEAAQPAAQAALQWNFSAPAEAADASLGEGAGPGLDRLRRGLVARWALDLPRRIETLRLPQEVLELYPAALGKLATFLIQAKEPYDPDYWAKDVRFVLGLTVPCGAQVVDLCARIGPGEVLRHSLAGRGIGAGLAYLAAQGWGRWAQIHTESRDLAAFNEAGWDDCYKRVAALLRTRPDLRGVMGSSWFYDPPLRDISPRLAYLQDRPMANGAFLVHQGTSPLYTERCTQTSPTRRDLVAAGLYTPRSWILAWPRAALITWAETQLAA